MDTVHARIQAIIDRFRPLVQADGGDIELLEASSRRATVRLHGKCAGCPSSPLTMHLGLESAIKDEVQGFSELIPPITVSSKVMSSPSANDPDSGATSGPRRREPLPSESIVIGRSPRMREVLDFVSVIADGDSSVLITGESGTGKELIANLIHRSSPRRHKPFVAVSCAILSETLIESELFGHERGAFTNAIKDRPGRFESATGGTLFLDDIDDVPLSVQVKLLRVLQNRTIERVGSVRAIPIDARVITGTKRDLRRLVADGSFREDLFYRLNVIPIQLPPLRDRVEDIPLLIDHFFNRYFRSRGKDPRPMSAAMLRAFMHYPWPGNVRELENACERIAQTCICEAVVAGCVPAAILFHKRPASSPADRASEVAAPPSDSQAPPVPISLDERLDTLEVSLIAWALRASGGNKSKAAVLLQVRRSTLGDRIKKLGLGHLEAASDGSS